MFTSVVMACRTASPLVTRGRSPPALPTAQPVQLPKRDGADCVHAHCFPLNCASACSHTSACCLAAARVFAPATRIIKRLQRARYAHGSEAANESRDLHNRNAVPLHLAHSTSSAAPVATAACISHVSLRYSQAGKSKLSAFNPINFTTKNRYKTKLSRVFYKFTVVVEHNKQPTISSEKNQFSVVFCVHH